MTGWDLDGAPLFSWEVSWARVAMTALSFASFHQNHPREGLRYSSMVKYLLNMHRRVGGGVVIHRAAVLRVEGTHILSRYST